MLLALSLALSACGEKTKREIAQEPELRARLDQFREQTESLAAGFSYETDPIELAAALDPRPSGENTLMLSTKELASVFSSDPLTKDDYLGLGTAGGLGHLLQSSYASEPAEVGWLERLNRVLDTRYLAVYWTPSFVPPKIINDTHYEGGTATVSLSIYDRKAKQWILRFQVGATAKGRVKAETEKWKLEGALVFEIIKMLRKDLLDQIDRVIEEKTGGALRESVLPPVELES